MNFGWGESLLYAITMGITEILPVSSPAHSRILLKFMGRTESPSLLRLFVHLGILAALVLACQPQILKMLRAQKMARIPKRKRKRPLDAKSLMDLHLCQTMLVPVVLGLVFRTQLEALASNTIIMATFLFVSGLVLYIPQFLPSGNRDSRSLSRVEGLLMGLGGMLFAVPGFSGVGAALSVASVTGVDRKFALTMVLLMNLGILAGQAVYDVLGLVSAGLAGMTFVTILCYLLAGVVAFLGAMLAVKWLKMLSEDKGYAVFSYYSWGLALFTLVLTLMA